MLINQPFVHGTIPLMNRDKYMCDIQKGKEEMGGKCYIISDDHINQNFSNLGEVKTWTSGFQNDAMDKLTIIEGG